MGFAEDEPALKLGLEGKDYLLFDRFASRGLESSLGLLEHLASEAQGHSSL